MRAATRHQQIRAGPRRRPAAAATQAFAQKGGVWRGVAITPTPPMVAAVVCAAAAGLAAGLALVKLPIKVA